jgi:DNA-binding beta-propeller fold protein YncE
MKNLKLNLFSIALIAFLSFACAKNEDATPSGKYSSGVFIINEGAFQTGTGTISFFNRDNKTVENDIFQTTNNRPLGNIVQSVEIHKDRAYIVVNNAKKVEVVQAWDFKQIATIQGFEMPRYLIGIDDNKAYVSEWGLGGVNGAVKVVDLKTNTITKTILVGKGAEKMLKIGTRVFVTCNGGFDNENKLFVIDVESDEVRTIIDTPNNTNSLVVDSNNKLWVTCAGRSQWNGTTSVTASPAQLIRINPFNNQIEQRFTFGKHGLGNLNINAGGNILFYTYDSKVFTHNINDNALNNTAIISRYFYGLGFDKQTNLLYAADAGNFSSNGKMIRFNPNGSVLDSLTVGVIPNGFYFR